MAIELMPGANIALPDRDARGRAAGAVRPVRGGPRRGRPGGRRRRLRVLQPALGARGGAAPGRVTVTPARLRAGAARVVVLASPEQDGQSFGALSANGGPARPRAWWTGPARCSPGCAPRGCAPRPRCSWPRSTGGTGAGGCARSARATRTGWPGWPATSGWRWPRSRPPAPAAEVVAVTNAERRRHGLPAFTVDARLGAAAQLHSADMLRRGFFDHRNPDGEQVWDRARTVGYPYRKVAENIAAGQRTAAEVVAGWMDSPGHRRNILDAELHQIGVGHVTGGTTACSGRRCSAPRADGGSARRPCRCGGLCRAGCGGLRRASGSGGRRLAARAALPAGRRYGAGGSRAPTAWRSRNPGPQLRIPATPRRAGAGRAAPRPAAPTACSGRRSSAPPR